MMSKILRTGFVVLALVGAALYIYHDVRRDVDQQTIAALQQMNDEMQQRLQEHREMIDRLSRSRRIAHLEVLHQQVDSFGDAVTTEVQLTELDEGGRVLGRQRFTVPGGVVFIDAWTAKFDAGDVAHGHPMRGRTIVLLRRVYSELMAPIDGYAIDMPGAIPTGYAASDVAEFEQRIWQDFWQIAADPERARSMGVRIAQGEAVYAPVQVGRTYELTVDAVGGLNLRPVESGAASIAHVESDGGRATTD